MTRTVPEEGRPFNPMDVNSDGNVAFMNVLLSGEEQRSFKTTGVAKETSNQAINPNNFKNVNNSISKDSNGQIQHPICEKCSEDITINFQKDTIFLSCNYIDYIICLIFFCFF